FRGGFVGPGCAHGGGQPRPGARRRDRIGHAPFPPGLGLWNTRARGGGRPPRASRVLLFRRMRSPAAFAPLPKTGTLGAQGRVASVSGVDPRVIGHRPEHTLLHVAEQCPKVLVGPGTTDTTGKEAVP